MIKLLVLLGPTATGKTDLGLSLAKKINGELIACDSRQVYKGLDIGTGKMPGKNAKVKKHQGFWEIEGTPIWMYDVADPKDQFNVFDYFEKVIKVIKDIKKRGKLPIIVGGTGLYLKALFEDMNNLKVSKNASLREELNALSVHELQSRVEVLSPTVLENLNSSDRNNSRRLIRQIEILIMNPYVDKSQITRLKTQNYSFLKIGLYAPRSVLNSRIDQRLLARLDLGMVLEAKKILKRGVTLERMKELGLEYKYLALFLEGELTKEEFVSLLKIKIHQYAKRQMTWFKKEKDVFWFDITEKGFETKVEKQVLAWYNGGYGT